MFIFWFLCSTMYYNIVVYVQCIPSPFTLYKLYTTFFLIHADALRSIRRVCNRVVPCFVIQITSVLFQKKLVVNILNGLNLI